MGVEPDRRQAHPYLGLSTHRGLRRVGRHGRKHQGDHRLLGWLGAGQRAVHRDLARGDCGFCERRNRGRDCALRVGAWGRYRKWPAARRSAGQHQLARTLLGVAVLMGVSLIATVTLLPKSPTPTRRESITEPIRALRHRALAITSIVGLLYNWGFFTLLGYSPFLMHLSPLRLGAVFCGLGVLVALFAVFVAPWLKAHFGTARSLYANFVLLAAVLAVIAIWPDRPAVVIVAVIVAGAFLG